MGTETAELLVTLVALTAVGFGVRAAFRLIGIPPAVSLIGLGMLLRGLPTNPLPDTWLEYRPVLSYCAFVLLLLRAGLMVAPSTVRLIILPAAVLGTIPVAAELFAAAGISRLVLFDDWGICLLASFIVAAVSPAVILPIMIRQREQNRSAARLVPERIIGITIINAFVAQTGILTMLEMLAPGTTGYDAVGHLILQLPITIAGGVLLGTIVGFAFRIDWILSDRRLFGLDNQRGMAGWMGAVLAFLVALGVYAISKQIGVDSVIATLALGVCLRRYMEPWLHHVDHDLKRLWTVAEIVLFVNVGSYVDVTLLGSGSIVVSVLLIIVGALVVRVGTAHIILRYTRMSAGEKRYTELAQIPKATIQAVFGAMPLAVFTERQQDLLIGDGQTIVVLAAVAIIATAPLGAVTLERRAEQLLENPDTASGSNCDQ